MKPTVGRIVHFTTTMRGVRHVFPAMVIKENDEAGQAFLRVFDGTVCGEYTLRVPYAGDDVEAGTPAADQHWTWPPRAT